MKTKAGAIAFGRHYAELVNHAQSTGNTNVLSAIETSDSETCKKSHASVERIYNAGGSIRGGDWSVEQIFATPNPATKGWLVSAIVSFGPQTIVWPSPKKSERLTGGKLPINLQLKWAGSAWKVAECTRGALIAAGCLANIVALIHPVAAGAAECAGGVKATGNVFAGGLSCSSPAARLMANSRRHKV